MSHACPKGNASLSLSLSLSKECGSSCTRRYDHVWVIGCVWGGSSSLICCVGDGRGRVGETLGRKPSRFPPKTEALAERSCRTAVLSGTAVERRTHPYTTKPSLGAPPLSPAPWEAGRAPPPMGGHPLHPPRGMPRGDHLAGQVMQSVPPPHAQSPGSLRSIRPRLS